MNHCSDFYVCTLDPAQQQLWQETVGLSRFPVVSEETELVETDGQLKRVYRIDPARLTQTQLSRIALYVFKHTGLPYAEVYERVAEFGWTVDAELCYTGRNIVEAAYA